MDESMSSTTFTLDGYDIVESLGVVRGVTVRSRSLFGTIGAKVETMFGGHISILTTLCERARGDAFDILLAHAQRRGANAVVGVRYDATEIMSGVTEVLCYGTAVVVEPTRAHAVLTTILTPTGSRFACLTFFLSTPSASSTSSSASSGSARSSSWPHSCRRACAPPGRQVARSFSSSWECGACRCGSWGLWPSRCSRASDSTGAIRRDSSRRGSASGAGKTFGLGAAVAIGASILGMAVNMPTGRRLAEIIGRLQSAGRPPTPEEQATLAALQVRLGRASVLAAVLLVIATLLMAIARYVP